MTAGNEDHRISNDIPDHVNDRDGIISIFIMGVAILLLLLLILAVVQAI